MTSEENRIERMATKDIMHNGKARILLAASGSVASSLFGLLCRYFLMWADVRAVVTVTSLNFIDSYTFPDNVDVYGDCDDWSSWKQIGDSVLHVELQKWADVMVVAPLSANTLAKIAGGLCDNLLTCIVRSWDYKKPLFVAPDMTVMWDNPLTKCHLYVLHELGISILPPTKKWLACSSHENGAMSEPEAICSTVYLAVTGKPFTFFK